MHQIQLFDLLLIGLKVRVVTPVVVFLRRWADLELARQPDQVDLPLSLLRFLVLHIEPRPLPFLARHQAGYPREDRPLTRRHRGSSALDGGLCLGDTLPSELEIFGPGPKRGRYANICLAERDERGHRQNGVSRKVVRLQFEVAEEFLGEVVDRQSEPSVEMGREHHIFPFPVTSSISSSASTPSAASTTSSAVRLRPLPRLRPSRRPRPSAA